MRVLLLIAAILISNTALGSKCEVYVPPNGEKVDLRSDDTYWYFSVPSTLEGKALESVVVARYEKDGKGVFGSWLAFKSEGDHAKGQFVFCGQRVEGELIAYYGEADADYGTKCSPR